MTFSMLASNVFSTSRGGILAVISTQLHPGEDTFGSSEETPKNRDRFSYSRAYLRPCGIVRGESEFPARERVNHAHFARAGDMSQKKIRAILGVDQSRGASEITIRRQHRPPFPWRQGGYRHDQAQGRSRSVPSDVHPTLRFQPRPGRSWR